MNNNNLRPQECVYFRPEKSPLMLNFVNFHTVKQLSVHFDLDKFSTKTKKNQSKMSKIALTRPFIMEGL